MPGLIGFYGELGDRQPADLLVYMAQVLESDPRFRHELHQAAGVGVGRVTLGIVNAAPQPHWNEDQTVATLIEGELYDTAVLRQQLATQGHPCRQSGDAELLLRLYEVYGEAFFVRLNGNFLAAIWDKARHKLLVFNDRLGQYPVYYAHHQGVTYFGSGVRALLAVPTLPRDVDRLAIAQFLTFDHVLHDRTFAAAVRLLPQASVLVMDGQGMAIRPYWSLRYPEQYPLRPPDEYVAELDHLLRQAVTRQAEGDLATAVLLSGGLDSRMILAILNELPAHAPLHTFTWGIPGCDDARYAKEVAALTRAEHHFFELPPDYLLRTTENSVRITDGLGNIVNLHALATLEEETRYASVIYKGFLGDAMFGYALRHQFWADYDDETRLKAHLQVYHDQGVITFDPYTEHDHLFSADFLTAVGDGVLAGLRDGMTASGVRPLATQRLYFDLTQRVPRMTLQGVEVVRNRAIVRLPFADNDLVEFSTRIPPGLMYERGLPRQAFVQAYPRLARVPLTDSYLPMVDDLHSALIRLNWAARWWLNRRGLARNPYELRRPYNDYANWFRTVLRSWIEDTLLSQRHLERGDYNPAAIRQIVADHMAGKNQTVRIGALMSIELWRRQFIDGR
jgi:asparagine synthase (glutamine-hydrolysing)